MKKLFTILALLMAFTVNGFAQEDTWTVAGSSTDILGSEWSTADTNNDMTLVNGNYVLVKSVELANDVELKFKVCKNHDWGEDYPSSGDYYLKIPAGTWDVVFMFNTTDNAVYAVYKAQLLGSWNWNTSVENLTLTRGEGAVWTGELDRTDVLGDQEFKLVLNDGGTAHLARSGYGENALLAVGRVEFEPCARDFHHRADLDSRVVAAHLVHDGSDIRVGACSLDFLHFGFGGGFALGSSRVHIQLDRVGRSPTANLPSLLRKLASINPRVFACKNS